MIAWLKGRILEMDEDRVILVTQDIGYEILCTRTVCIGRKAGDELEIHIHSHSTEHSTEWFGFATSQEKAVFRKLISVQGVGPKVALGMLGHFGMRETVRLLTSGQDRILVQAPGVGKKLAARMVMELKEALFVFLERTPSMEIAVGSPGRVMPGQQMEKALIALKGLGYRPQELSSITESLLERAQNGAPVDEMIREGLALLRKEKP